jgi:hypothetical protein
MLALSGAGGVRLAMLVARELAARGETVRVLAPSYAARSPVELEGAGLEVIDPEGGSKAAYMRSLVRRLRTAEGVVVSTGYLTPALIHLSGTGARLFGMVQGDEISSHIRYGNRPAWLKPLLAGVAGLGYRVPGYRVAISEFIRERVGRRFIDEVIPAGIRSEFIAQIPTDAAVRHRGERLTVGFLPVPGRNKGLAVALDAFAGLDAMGAPLRFVAFDGEYAAHDLPGFVEPFSRAAPAADADSIVRFYRSCDAFVLPSLVEGFGLPPLEAMACGAAAVVSDCGGPREYAREGHNALVTAPGNPTSLRSALLSLAGDEELRARLVRGGYETAARYPEADFVQRCSDAVSRQMR